MVRQDRSQIDTCSIFDTIRLLGEKSSLHEQIITILHKDNDIVYGIQEDSEEPLIINNNFDKNITHFESVSIITDTELLIEDVIKEKEENSIVYLDETVYSSLFEYISSHIKYSSLSLEKREYLTQTLFNMIKSNQSRLNDNEKHNENVPSDIHCNETNIQWTHGTQDSVPILVQEQIQLGIISRPYIMPILTTANKNKFQKNVIQNYIENTRDTLQHVCSIPNMISSMEYVREYIDDIHRQKRTEYVKKEASPYTLNTNPFECEFKYKNLYRSNNRTICSSDGGGDRLYYTDLSRSKRDTNTIDTVENDFTRVIHYPSIRKYTDVQTNVLIPEYYSRPAELADARFNLRYISPYVKGNIEKQKLIHPHRFTYPLIQYVNAIEQSNKSMADISVSTIGKRIKSVKDALTIPRILHPESSSNILSEISNSAHIEQLLSCYSLSLNDVSPKIRNTIFDTIRKRTTQLRTMSKKYDNKNRDLSTAIDAYKILFHNTIQRFMNLTQNQSDYVTINQELSQTCVKIRTLQKKWTTLRNIPNEIMGMEISTEIQSHHLYAWIYTLCTNAYEYSSFLDHVYDDPALDSNRSTSIIDTLIRTVVNIYQFDEVQTLTPKDTQHMTLSICDIQNIIKTNSLISSADSGKLFGNLLNNKHRFAYIVSIKEELLDFGRRRYEHEMSQKRKHNENSQSNDNNIPWKDLSEAEQLKYTPNQKYSKQIFKEILQPLVNTFRSSPRGLCSSHNVVKVYNSVEEMTEDVQEPMINSYTTFSNSVMRSLKSLLDGRQGDTARVDDELFDRLYYSITKPEQLKTRTQRLIRDGEYVSIRNTNILYQRLGQTWQREEIDLDNELTQCPFNFTMIEELGWENLTQHATTLSNTSLDSMCVYEERLQECLPYPLHKMYQFILKLFARYYEIATNIHTIEKQYTEIVATMKRVIAENPPPPKQVLQKIKFTSNVRDTNATQLQTILKMITMSELFDEEQLRGCALLLSFIKTHMDRSRIDDAQFIHWKFTHPKLCRHWSSFATAALSDPTHTNQHETRTSIIHTFFQQWPCDKNKYCLCCGSSVAQFTDEMKGNEWEQISEGKEAVRSIQTDGQRESIQATKSALSAAEIAEDKELNDHIRTFLKMFAKTMGMTVPDDSFSILCTNVVIPRINMQTYPEFVAEVVSLDPKLEKRKATIEKDRLKYAERANADPDFFHTRDSALLQFFHRQIKTEKPKKQKKLTKHIQTLEWLDAYYHNYIEEQQLIAVLSTLYIHAGIHIPNFTINKKDSMSDVKLTINVFADLEQKKYTFIQTISVFLYRLLTTPSELTWPSIETRKRMVHKIRTNRGENLTNEGAAHALYRPRMIAYIEQLRDIYPQFEQLRQKKAEYIRTKIQSENKALTSYRPIYDRSYVAGDLSPVQQLMNKMEKKLNTADIVPYATSSCVFPYVHDDMMTHPYIQSLFGTAPTLPVVKDKSHKDTHTLFVPHESVKPKKNQNQQTSSDYTFLHTHSAQYLESRCPKLLQEYSPTGERQTYKPIQVSAALLQSPEYTKFKNEEEMSTTYHPAIVDAVEHNTNIIYRNMSTRNEAQFQNNQSTSIDKTEFQQRIMAWRKTQVIPEAVYANLKQPDTFQTQFHAVCMQLWEDNEVIKVLREESSESQLFFSDTKINNSIAKEQPKLKQKRTRAQHIQRLEHIIREECKRSHGVSELVSLLEIGEHIYQIMTCIQCFLSSRFQNVWFPIMKKYTPATGKDALKHLKNEILQIRTVHTMSKQVMIPLTQHYQNVYSEFPKNISTDVLSIRSVRTILNSMNMTQFDVEEKKYIHLLFVYIVVKQITLVDSLSITREQKRTTKQACLQIIRDITSIRQVSAADMDLMQQYIDQKNNSSRVRSIEKLKRIDPDLENSHHMFRRNNLGNLSSVGTHTEFNENENEDLEEIINVEEEGYSTLLEEDGEVV